MKPWINKARSLLEASLQPPSQELNEIDWKSGLSPVKKRLTEHLSALSNYPGGGFLIYGIGSSGELKGVTSEQTEEILNMLSNLGRNALEPAITIDHSVETFDECRLLFVHIMESEIKPVHARGSTIESAFIRCGGTTRKASRQEIGKMMQNSRTSTWEEQRASVLMVDKEMLGALNTEPLFEMLERPMPATQEEMLDWMGSEGLINREPSGGGYITNLGAISAARKLSDFADLCRKAARVIVYRGLSKSVTVRDQEGTFGYAIGFQGLLRWISGIVPQSHVIEQALRTKIPVYPPIALRELIANALIHQDFTITGTGPLIEIFDDRIVISNPGGLLPSKKLDRLIGTQPESRNDRLARSFRRYRICEEQGSGLLKAGIEIELYGLPPMEFSSDSNSFKVTLFSPRTFSSMSPHERLEACYQHAVLKYYASSTMTNKSLRERLKMPEKQRSVVSLLIQEAIDMGRIKNAKPQSKSRKYAEYVPAWA